MRPFNWVQWTGVALFAVAMAMALVRWAGRFGWIEPHADETSLSGALNVMGLILIMSRREPVPDDAPGLSPARRGWLVVLFALAVALAGTAIFLQFLGA
jgi:hypothetical protein